jgi:hypothetical protein
VEGYICLVGAQAHSLGHTVPSSTICSFFSLNCGPQVPRPTCRGLATNLLGLPPALLSPHQKAENPWPRTPTKIAARENAGASRPIATAARAHGNHPTVGDLCDGRLGDGPSSADVAAMGGEIVRPPPVLFPLPPISPDSEWSPRDSGLIAPVPPATAAGRGR